MPELDPFEARLAAAVHAFADRAETSVDAMAVADRAIGSRRHRGRLGLIWASVPVPIAVLITLGLLVGLLAWSVTVGGPHRDPRSIVVAPTPTATAAATAMAAATTTPAPTTDGEGDEYVTGSATVQLTRAYDRTAVGDTNQLRGGVMTFEVSMNDPRVSGIATFPFSADLYPNGVGPDWGSFRLENAEGAWDGTCRGVGWRGGEYGAMACWLAGSEAFAGYTYYFQAVATQVYWFKVDGLIYPGSPPAQQGEG